MTLEAQVKVLLEEIRRLKEINKKLEERTKKQDIRIAYLEEELRKKQINRNSSNSSKPPSTDMYNQKRNQSLRVRTGKKSGGQLGHEGAFLKMTETPDEIIKIEPNYCNHCGCSLEEESSEIQNKRQVIDIPKIQRKVTEYQNYIKCCPKCGHKQQGGFPEGIKKHIQYGKNIESAVTYFSVYQYMPYKRLVQCMKQLFNIDISQGSIDNILSRMALKAEPVYQKIKENISKSEQVGSDETSVKVNGKKWWEWVWQSAQETYLSVSESRGSKAIEAKFPNGLKQSILTTDRWPAQLKTEAKAHQLCIAHLLRDLEFLIQAEKNEWSIQLKQLLKSALEMKKICSQYRKDDIEMIQIEQKLDILLRAEIPKDINPKTLALQKSLTKHRESIFTFLYHAGTPSDNNGSERSIRNAKVKQKISGQFKTGQHAFCTLRSVIDTCIKRGYDIFDALVSIAKLVPTE
ncbi:MAG: transposase [Bacteroidota bacterium]|nr:transposase [Bacteroidota bacterium]